jgi:ELWxxDGT repeat protein
MVEFKDELYFTTIRSGKRSLWKIAKGAREPVILIDARLTDLNPSKLYPNGGKLFVQGFQQADHLWMLYDAETNELKELQRFPKQAINAVLTDIRNDEPHFFLNVLDYNLSHGKNNMLWYCNGNRESVEFIDTVTINGNSYMGEVLVSGAKLYCTINQQGENDKTWPVLHVVDAEKGTIKPLKDENDNLLIGAKGLSVVGNYIIFSAANSRDVMESPTIVTSTYSYNPKANELVTLHRTSETVRPQFTPNFNHKGLLYFAYGKNRGVHNFDRQLWVTDGTPEGTELVSNIWPLSGYFNNYNFAEEEGEMYFPGGETKHGFEIWKVNSEDKTIQMVTNIEHSDGVNYTSCLTALPGKLIFTHSNLTYGEELWILDSKRERLLIDINKRTGF